LFSPTIVASWCASFGANGIVASPVLVSWQGAFLIKGLGFTQGSIGLFTATAPVGFSKAVAWPLSAPAGAACFPACRREGVAARD
jgi:hypothetical protein